MRCCEAIERLPEEGRTPIQAKKDTGWRYVIDGGQHSLSHSSCSDRCAYSLESRFRVTPNVGASAIIVVPFSR